MLSAAKIITYLYGCRSTPDETALLYRNNHEVDPYSCGIEEQGKVTYFFSLDYPRQCCAGNFLSFPIFASFFVNELDLWFSFRLLAVLQCMINVQIDKYGDLLVPFHSVMMKAVASVWDAYDSSVAKDSEGFLSNIRKWMTCSFTGEETYNTMSEKLSSHITNVCDYVALISEMPYMNLLFSIHDEQPFHYVMVSILMTLECFEKFSKDTSYNDYNKLVIHDFTTSLLCDTEDSSHPISDNIKEVPIEVHNQQSLVTEDGDQKNYVDEASHPIHDNNTEVQSEVQDQTSICDELDVLIDEMYLVAQQVAADGNQGIGQ